MIAFLANIFGYLLNFFNNLLGNYGLAIILFCLVMKIAMIPLSIKQQKSQKKSMELQEEVKAIQFKYKNDPEKLNKETMELYKREKMSPFSGCFLAIIQMILLISVFYMVREPLTFVKNIDKESINNYVTTLKEEELIPNEAYSQMAVISEANKIKVLKDENSELDEKQKKLSETFGDKLNEISTNMDFIGIDLSKVPSQNSSDFKVYIIPVLYVISSFASIKLTTAMQTKKKEKDVIEIENENDSIDEEKTEETQDPMEQANKNMALIMPIMAVSISLIAPLGLALYWLTNNVLMILERLVLNKVIKDEEE